MKFKEAAQQEKLSLLKNDEIDFLRNPSFKYDVDGLAMVPASQITWFEDKLQEVGVDKEVVIEDLFKYVLSILSKKMKFC